LSSHGPETSAWRRRLGRFYFTGVFWYRLAYFGVRRLPSWAFRPVIFIFAGAFLIALPKVRRGLSTNLALVLGPATVRENWRRAFKTLRTFSWCLAERYEQFVPDVELEAAVEVDPSWERLRAEHPALVFVTAHFGGWEMGSVVARGIGPDMVVHSVREKELDPESDAFLSGLLAQLGGAQYHVHYANAGPALGVELLEALRAGESIALQADRPATDGQALTLELFGARVELPVGPAVLARLADVPIVPVFAHRVGRRAYRVVVHEPIRVARTKDRQADLRAAMQAIVGHVEDAVRSAPHQWFCFRALTQSAPH